MKGPGFPAFLAIANWFGISESLARALFHCFAVTFFVAICHRFIKSYLISGVSSDIAPLASDFADRAYLLRVLRDQIYYGQTLLVLGTMLWMLFGPLEAKATAAMGGWCRRGSRMVLAHARGGPLDCARACAPGAGGRPSRVSTTSHSRTRRVAISGGRRLRSHPAWIFLTLNRLVYGKFVGVDVKEANFRRALGAIDSVRSGGTKPFVSITHAAMQRVDAVSPAFASLAPYFDGPGKGWETWGCQANPSLCGEIGSGWFMWALRDAVAATGHYRSPADASAFFGRIADEISVACQRGAFECQPQLIPEMPPISWPDVWKLLLPRSADAFDLLVLRDPPLQINPSSGGEEILEPALRFLNYPLHARSPDVSRRHLRVLWLVLQVRA